MVRLRRTLPSLDAAATPTSATPPLLCPGTIVDQKARYCVNASSIDQKTRRSNHESSPLRNLNSEDSPQWIHLAPPSLH